MASLVNPRRLTRASGVWADADSASPVAIRIPRLNGSSLFVEFPSAKGNMPSKAAPRRTGAALLTHYVSIPGTNLLLEGDDFLSDARNTIHLDREFATVPVFASRFRQMVFEKRCGRDLPCLPESSSPGAPVKIPRDRRSVQE